MINLNAEIYSPPYLFKPDGSPAKRPTITSVSSAAIGYGASFQVRTPDAANIKSVVLIRPGAPTHAFDMEQRLVGLSFTAGPEWQQITVPFADLKLDGTDIVGIFVGGGPAKGAFRFQVDGVKLVPKP